MECFECQRWLSFWWILCIHKLIREIYLVEFVNENERVISAYAADEINTPSTLVRLASPRGDQLSSGSGLSLDPKACYPSSPNAEEHSSGHKDRLGNSDGPFEDALLLGPSPQANSDESDDLQQRPLIQLERKGRGKTAELKFPTFGKKLQFDTFRPIPRSHFSSDALSVWPLRSIEESRLLQHFIQNLAAWVRL